MMWQRRTHGTRAAAACGFCVAVWLLPFALMGQDEAASEDEAWKAERTKLEEVIAQRVKEDVDKTIKQQDIATKLGLRSPVRKPPKSKDEVAAEVEKQLDELAAKQFPDARRKEFEKEAADKYRMYEVGEEVSFSIRGGMGPNALVKGRLYEKTKQRIKAGSRFVLRTDMDAETQSHFWEDVNEDFRKRHIRVQNTQYDAKISAFKEEQRETKLPEALRAAHYIRDPKKPKSLKLSDWVAEADVLDFFYKKQSEAYEAEVKPKITEQVFVSNGYELVEDTINGTKEWMPKKQALTFRERLKELIERKKQEELEAGANKPAADPWGAAPAGGEPGMPGAEPGMPGPGMGPGMPGPEPGMAAPGMGPGAPGPAPSPATAKPGGGKQGGNPFDENQ